MFLKANAMCKYLLGELHDVVHLPARAHDSLLQLHGLAHHLLRRLVHLLDGVPQGAEEGVRALQEHLNKHGGRAGTSGCRHYS